MLREQRPQVLDHLIVRQRYGDVRPLGALEEEGDLAGVGEELPFKLDQVTSWFISSMSLLLSSSARRALFSSDVRSLPRLFLTVHLVPRPSIAPMTVPATVAPTALANRPGFLTPIILRFVM